MYKQQHNLRYRFPGAKGALFNWSDGGRGSDNKVFPGGVQQFKLLPREDTKPHFRYPRADM